MENIFRKGDRVFHIHYGWGIIEDEVPEMLIVAFDSRSKRDDKVGVNKFVSNLLSFTAYTLEGFSQERPEELPKKGQVVWVRDLDDQAWYVSMFWDYDPSEPDGPYVVTPNFYEGDHECYRFMTTKNPYENEQ
jgi:hypothetical protein